MPKSISKRKKMSKSPSSSEPYSTTSEDVCDKRPKLRAKRQLSNRKSESNDDKQDNPKDTPQMRTLREKMMQRQLKGNAAKLSKIIKNPEIKDSPTHDADNNTSVNEEIINEKGMTPQMRIFRAKLEARRSMTSMNKQKANSVSHTNINDSKKILTHGKRAKSLGSTLSLASDSEDNSSINNNNNNNNNQRRRLSLKPSRNKKSRSSMIDERLKSIRTVEAPPGVACKRIIENNETTSKAESERDCLSLDLALTSSSSSCAMSEETPLKKLRVDHNNSCQEASCSTGQQSKSCEVISPNIYKNAEERLRSLRHRLSLELQTSGQDQSDTVHDSIANTTNTYYEEMEWEPVQEARIFHEIQSARAQLNFQHTEEVLMNEIIGSTLSLSEVDGNTTKKRSLYIVIDTNVFLTDLKKIEMARDSIFKCYGRPIIVIPWTTIRELDFIKDDKTNVRPESLKAKARHAINFLNQHFSAKHPRIVGQTPTDVAMNKHKFAIECPDDEILQTCLQIHESKNTVVLLSYDKNLCNKAMVHDIMTLGRDDNFEKVDMITEFDCRNETILMTNLKNTGEDSQLPQSPIAKELEIAADLYEEVKTVLTSFLTIIVAKQMEELFGDNWERYTTIQPPWSTINVINCAIKHWIATVSDSFIRRAESILKELLEKIHKFNFNRNLNDVKNVIQLTFDLVQCLKADKHPNLLTKFTTAINELRKKCHEAQKEIQEYQMNDEIGTGMNEDVQESRANVAFSYFKNTYNDARDLCGIAAQLMNVQCSFSYNRNNRQLDIEDIKNRRPEVAANVNRLLLTLSTALEDVQQLNINHPIIIALYNALDTLYNSLFPDLDAYLADALSPIDIYFCLKRKEKSLKFGVGQFQELSSHFCRMASIKSI